MATVPNTPKCAKWKDATNGCNPKDSAFDMVEDNAAKLKTATNLCNEMDFVLHTEAKQAHATLMVVHVALEHAVDAPSTTKSSKVYYNCLFRVRTH